MVLGGCRSFLLLVTTDRIQLSHCNRNDDTGVKGLETTFRRANAEQHIYI